MQPTAFSRRIGTLLIAFCAALAVAPGVGAAEEGLDAYRETLKRHEMVNAELEAAIREAENPPPLPVYSERILSPRKNAVVSVGGEFRAAYLAWRSNPISFEADDPFVADTPPGDAKMAGLALADAVLSVDFKVTDRWRARFDVNLNGYQSIHRIRRRSNPNAPGTATTAVYPADDYYDRYGFIRAAYVELLKAGHSGFGFKIGRFELPFGLEAKPDLIGRSFMDAPDLAGSYLMAPLSWDQSPRLPHASKLLDPAWAAMLGYEMRDIVRFEAAVFQDIDGRRTRRLDGGGHAEYRSESGPPRSFQLGVSLLPLEDWELSARFRNRYSRTRGIRSWADSPYRSDFRGNLAAGAADPKWDAALGQWSDAGTGPSFGSVRNEQAFIAGLAVEIPDTKLAVQLEYAHGWNQGFNEHIRSDGVNLGLSYRLIPRLTLHGQVEWLYVKDKSWLVEGPAGWERDTRSNRLYRVLLGAEYELARGLTLEAGWQYEYWDFESYKGGSGLTRAERTLTANMLYAGTRLLF